MKMLQENARHLVSHYDLYATALQIANVSDFMVKIGFKRKISAVCGINR
jgi:hypothetical protein